MLQGIIDHLLNNQLIQYSISSCVILMLIVPKKDDKWHLYINSRAINKITIKYYFLSHDWRILLINFMVSWSSLKLTCKVDTTKYKFVLEQVKDNIWKARGIIWMDFYALCPLKQSQHLYETHKWKIKSIFGGIFHRILWWHLNIQPQYGRTPALANLTI